MLGDRGQSGGIGRRAGFVALSVAVAALFLCPVAVSAQEEVETVELETLLPIAAPTGLLAIDTPNDRGNSINVTWELSADDDSGGIVAGYEIFRSAHPETGFVLAGRVPFGVTKYRDSDVDNSESIYYKVAALDVDRSPFFSGTFGPVEASIQWFNRSRTGTMVAVIIFVLSIMYFVAAARSGKNLFIRRLAGLDEMDNAVGRATEMGKPILFISGLSSVSDVATIAAINILGEVAKKTAEYNTKLIVPCADPIVMAVEQEVVKEAYAKAGRPDAYNDDDVFYLTRSQFAYVAGVNGIMVRQRPATILYMGMFYAESLVLAETGSSIGAIQIAGTDAVTQLPFFITSCDYTLIGEELYAASAYLSREPILLGGLKGQDMFKLVAAVFLVVGVIAATLTATGVIESNFILPLLATG